MPRKTTPNIEIVVGPNGKKPVRAYAEAAGMDIFSAENKTIKPFEVVKIKTDLKFSIPAGYYLKIEERSGVSLNTFLKRKAGVVDSDYRGEVHIVMQNVSNQTQYVALGDKIAQAVVMKHEPVKLSVVEKFSSPNTERGSKGFGSSGM